MTKSVIVLGSTGMLGQAVLRVLGKSANAPVIGTYRSEALARELRGFTLLPFDAASGSDGVAALVRAAGGSPVLFINCIAALNLEIRESDAESIRRAELLNAELPHTLAAFAESSGSRVIHISTDGVFSGAAAEPYTEASVPDPRNTYGRTKLAGEPESPACLTIRTSIIGRDPLRKKGLLEWLANQPEGAKLQGYTDSIWSGVTTVQLARLCSLLIDDACFAAARAESPVHHFSPNEALSKYELLTVISDALEKKLEITGVSAPAGPSRRVLRTRFSVIPSRFGSGSIPAAVRELIAAFNPGSA